MLPRLYMYIAYTARLRKQQQQQKPNVFAKAVAPPGSGFRRSQHLENTTTGHLTYTLLRGNLSGDQRHTLRQFIAAADASRARWHANRQQTRQLILKRGRNVLGGRHHEKHCFEAQKSVAVAPLQKCRPAARGGQKGWGDAAAQAAPLPVRQIARRDLIAVLMYAPFLSLPKTKLTMLSIYRSEAPVDTSKSQRKATGLRKWERGE